MSSGKKSNEKLKWACKELEEAFHLFSQAEKGPSQVFSSNDPHRHNLDEVKKTLGLIKNQIKELS